MGERIQDSEPQWEPSPEHAAEIERLLASDDELERIYGEVYRARCFAVEFYGPTEANGVAAVGEMDEIAKAEQQSHTKIDIAQLDLSGCIALGAYPGWGNNRAERIRDGLRQVQEARERNDDLYLLSTYNENGYRVEAFMPATSDQKRQWTIKVFKIGEETPVKTETIPMGDYPVFGVDEEDEAMLERRVKEIIQELTQKSI